ncbi:MAG: BLUF domain-containing protein [Nitrospinae bacterium]|nr:BLUF domain-containing protein [Nitrospinota bacterium]
MHELFYCSMATREMQDADILDILNVSREKNTRLEVTGLLVYQKRTKEFMQILEGEKQVIFDLLDTIKADDRHQSLYLVYDGEVQERNFKNWTMAFADLDSVDKSKLEGVSEFLEKGFTHELLREKPSYATVLIDTFKKSLPVG